MNWETRWISTGKGKGMKKFCIYQFLQIKRALKLLPAVLAVSLLFGALAAGAAYGGAKLLYQDRAAGRIVVAVVTDAEDTMGQMALSMLGSMDSVESICDFVETTEPEAREGLKEGRYYAALLIPPGMVEGIMDGTNTPVRVLLSGQGGLETLLLKQLTESGARMLGASQAGIYAADFYCGEQGMEELIPQVEVFLNKVYLDYAMNRDGWFGKRTVSALGEMDLPGYYGTTALALLLFLMGIPCAAFSCRESLALENKLRAEGIGPAAQLLVKILAAAVLLLAALFLLAVPVSAGLSRWGVRGLAFSGYGVLCAVLAVLVCASMMIFCFEAARGLLAGAMLLFVLTGAFIFLSGGLLPAAFLPEILRALSGWNPGAAVRGLLGPLFGYEAGGQAGMAALVSFLVFFGLGLWSRRRTGR